MPSRASYGVILEKNWPRYNDTALYIGPPLAGLTVAMIVVVGVSTLVKTIKNITDISPKNITQINVIINSELAVQASISYDLCKSLATVNLPSDEKWRNE